MFCLLFFSLLFLAPVFAVLLGYGHVLLLPLETALRSLFLLRRSKVLRGTRSRGLASTFFSLAGVAVRLLVRMRMASRVPLLTRSLANLGQALFCTRCWPSFRVPRTRALGPDRRFCQTPKLLSVQINWITRRYASRSV